MVLLASLSFTGGKLMNSYGKDIRALFEHIGIDSSGYRVFSKKPVAAQPTTAEIPTQDFPREQSALENGIAKSMAAAGNSNQGLVENLPGPKSGMKRWRLLRSSREDEVAVIGRAEIEMFAFHSVVGGCGTTSIIASLSRAFSISGEQVAVADCSKYSTLPLYFGRRGFSAGLNTVMFPAAGVPVHVLLPPPSPESSESAFEAPGVWMWEPFDRGALGVQRILAELPDSISQTAEQRLFAHGTCISVIVPDMRSAISIQRFETIFKQRELRLGHPIHNYYLLNKFDPKSSLCVDIRNWLSQQLGVSMLPFVIRRDEAISEALAEGLTVFDYAPQSAAAEDVTRLTEWMRGAING